MTEHAFKARFISGWGNDFGYLKIKASANQLAVVFNCTNSAYGPAFDSVVVNLKTHKITEQPIRVEPQLQ